MARITVYLSDDGTNFFVRSWPTALGGIRHGPSMRLSAEAAKAIMALLLADELEMVRRREAELTAKIGELKTG